MREFLRRQNCFSSGGGLRVEIGGILRSAKRGRASCGSVLLLLLAAAPGSAQVLSKQLLFNGVNPCRIVDTRLAAAGMLVGGTTRTFDVVGPNTNYASQGGTASGCGIPGFAANAGKVQAVAVNVVAVNPTGEGFLMVWPSDQAAPLASTLNFQKLVPSMSIANGVIVPVRQDAQGGDIKIAAGVASTDVVVDITGYFTKAEPKKYYLSQSHLSGDLALLACAAGYHMASLVEILDPTDLTFDTDGDAIQFGSDQGVGPPSGVSGWVRTGSLSNDSTTPGLANCNAYGQFANGAPLGPGSRGTTVSLLGDLTRGATVTGPWNAATDLCVNSHAVWCKED